MEYRRRVVNTPDGDTLAIDELCGGGGAGMPLLVIFHGLEGSSQSGSVRRVAAYFGRRGWNVAVPHFRTCGGLMNRKLRAYHAADTDEVDWLLRHCRDAIVHRGLFAVGISLGGNALINWAARAAQGGDGKYDNANIGAIATISAPFDLAASVRLMGGGINRLLYERHFIKTLRTKLRHKQTQAINNAAIDKSRGIDNGRDIGKIIAAIDIDKVQTMAAFDECYTAPAHGFNNAADYWQQGSCNEQTLQKITLPLLCINAQNDPIIPPSSLPKTAPQNIKLSHPQKGAHAAFTGTPKDWLPRQLHNFFANHNQH